MAWGRVGIIVGLNRSGLTIAHKSFYPGEAVIFCHNGLGTKNFRAKLLS